MSAASGVRRAGYVAVAALMAGCYPALDWREVAVVEAGFVVLLPSRPSRDTRQVRIGPHTLSMTMLSARADGFLYGVGYAKLDKEIGTPAQAALLDDARTALLANFGANLPHASGDQRLAALESHPCVTIDAHPIINNRSLSLSARLCATGTHLYQLVSLAPRDSATAADASLFLGSLRLLK